MSVINNHFFYPRSCSAVDTYFNALILLQSMPGCEEETESLRTKMMNEFEGLPQLLDNEQMPHYKLDAYRYYSSGKVTHSNNEYYVMLNSWEPVFTEDKPLKKKAVSFSALNQYSPIWYAQVMMHRGRSFSFHKKYKTDFYKHLAAYKQYLELSDEHKAIVDSEELFSFLRNATETILDLLGRGLSTGYSPDWSAYYRFQKVFFLNHEECELIAQELESSQDRQSLYELLLRISGTQSVGRVYLPQFNFPQKEYQYENSAYYYEDRIGHYADPLHVESELNNLYKQLDTEHLSILKKLGFQSTSLQT